MKRYTYLRVLSALTLLTMIFAMCKKEEKADIPVIDVQSPTINQLFNISDSIPVKARIINKKLLNAVKVGLTDEDLIPVLPAIYFYPKTAEFDLDFLYPLNDNTLETGDYYMHIRAENSDTYRNKYQPIRIESNISISTKLITITNAGFSQLKVFETLDYENTIQLFEITCDYSDSEVNPIHDHLYVSGKNLVNVNAYELGSVSLVWEQELIAEKPMHNENCLYFDEYLFATFNYQYILGYNASGGIIFNTNIQDFDAPGKIFRHNEFILVDIQKKNTASPTLNTYYLLTGAQKQSLFTSFKVVEMFAASGNTVNILGNNAGQGQIYSYDIVQNNLVLHKSFDEQIECAVQSNPETILFGTENNVYSFLPEQNFLVELLTEIQCDKMEFDPGTSVLLISGDKEILIYEYPKMEYQKTLTFSDSILNIHLHYDLNEEGKTF